jgi:hypothetical protein
MGHLLDCQQAKIAEAAAVCDTVSASKRRKSVKIFRLRRDCGDQRARMRRTCDCAATKNGR